MSIENFYPGIENRKNYYALFCPPIDRFLIVDNKDPLLMFEVAKILSSKVNTVLYILNEKNIVDFNNTNCLEYTTENKKKEYQLGSSSAGSVKQSASMIHLQSPVIKVGEPSSKLEIIKDLQSYSIFCLKCTQAIFLGNALRNVFPEGEYLKSFFNGEYLESFVDTVDSTTSKKGIVDEIKSILYFSNTEQEALVKMDNLWRQVSSNDLSGFQQSFYDLLGIKKTVLTPEAYKLISETISSKIV